MATLRPRNKKAKHESDMEIIAENPKTRSARNGSASSSSSSSGGGCGPAVPLLDMLAEVASATLKSDPSLNAKRSPDKTFKVSPRKSSQLADVLSLDQIRVLSDRMLLEMFSEQTSDEIRRHYSYKCFLVPDKCVDVFRSFGSESKARLQMKSHLLSHIAELLAEANSSTKSGKSTKFKFTAEPLHARKKRLQDGLLKSRPKIAKNRNIPSSSSKKSFKSKDSQKSRISSSIKPKKHDGSSSKNAASDSATKRTSLSNMMESKKVVSSSECDNQDSTEETYSDDEEELPTKEKHSPQLSPIKTVIKTEPIDTNVKTPSKDEMMVKYVVDTLSQPQHDHNYTSVMGKKRGIESLHFEYCGSSEDEAASDEANSDSPGKHKKGYLYEFPQLIVATPCFPFVYVPLLPNIAQILEVKAEGSPPVLVNGGTHMYLYENIAEVTENCIASSNGYDGSSTSTGVLIPEIKGKQIRSRRIKRLIIPEEMEPDSDDDNSNSEEDMLIKQEQVEEEYEYATGSNLCQLEPLLLQEAAHSPKYTALRGDEATPEWERKLALKFIRALRTKRKDERGPLVCKICKNKTFTAQATLMYHYRSHAGIKPFICSVCGATFTRQHSLNYHMLIHNNKSRFVCGDCGRNFRHPSHYKEHLRRHTGETPYECGDCGLRFKTRNTYKRHLKTRHGKLLTAQGIMTLTMEEFYKESEAYS